MPKNTVLRTNDLINALIENDQSIPANIKAVRKLDQFCAALHDLVGDKDLAGIREMANCSADRARQIQNLVFEAREALEVTRG